MTIGSWLIYFERLDDAGYSITGGIVANCCRRYPFEIWQIAKAVKLMFTAKVFRG